jgi:hypothetical protein
MSLIYTEAPAVSPFFIAPFGRHKQEATIILGSSWLAKNEVSFLAELYGSKAMRATRCPVIAQVFRFKGKIIAATSLSTKAVDPNSGRHGLKLTVGVAVSPEIFYHHNNAIHNSHISIDSYLYRIFGANLSSGGADRFVDSMQREEANAQLIFGDSEDLIATFESIASISSHAPASILTKVHFLLRVSRLLREARFKPCLSFKEALEYWIAVDQWLR